MSALAKPSSRTVSSFAVVAEATPGMLERVVTVLARGFPMPRRFASTHHHRAGRLALNLELADLDPGQADLLAARLRGVVGVEKVFVATADEDAV